MFVRLGHLAGAGADIQALLGGTATARVLSGASMQTRGTTIDTDMAYSPVLTKHINPWTTLNTLPSSVSGVHTGLKSMAEKTMIEQVHADATLPAKDLTLAIKELIRQMTANSTTINASSVSAGSQTDVGTPNGNPIIVMSLKRPDGLIYQTTFAETLRFQTTADSQAGGTLRQETVTIKGQAPVSDPFAYNWPAGSGASLSVTLVDAALDNSGGNKLTNSDFETYSTANYADNWVISIGTAGTNVYNGGSSDAYIGSACLKLTGDGSTLLTLYQQFNQAASTSAGSGGTPSKVAAQGQYAIFGKVKVSAVPSTGILRVALVDSGGTVINDDAGTANSFTVTLTAQTTSYATFTGTFRLPSVLPSTVRLQLKTTTALESGKSAYIDSLAMAEMTPLYTGGPSVAIFAGATKTIIGDTWTVAITNTVGTMAAWVERFFSLREKLLIIPYTASSPTVADSLVA